MRLRESNRWLALSVALGMGLGLIGQVEAASKAVPYFADWPTIHSAIKVDPQIESKIKAILARMTLEEKVGQMLQPDFREVTPDEIRQYKIGSVLNGGGGWPDNNKHAAAEAWAKQADQYWLATEQAFASRGFRIPFMWATDAVHGHNNVFQATIFPHNIGLGAAYDPDLIYRIGQATAMEVAATGLDWTFAPTVAVPRDDRWGRTYEGYAEDPSIVYAYAGAMVRGLQGSAHDLKGQRHVVSTVKHFVGDGGTRDGIDRGDNFYSESDLRNIHAMGYFSGLNAGAQVVMASFNSWQGKANYAEQIAAGSEYNGKLHGSKYMLTDVLKHKMGFDGVVVSDWNGHSEIAGCSMGACNAAVMAGIDVFMVTARKDWMAFRSSLLAAVHDQQIPMSRIDDAVTRILRVKMRAGMWDKPMPSQRLLAGKQAVLSSQQHRMLAREAVRKSLVLLKNSHSILPLKRGQKVLVAGSAANDLGKQVGGWSLTWQGTENTAADFPYAVSVQSAIEQTIGKQHVMSVSALSSAQGDKPDVAIVVMGEDPYAEWFGDIPDNKTLSYAEMKSSYGEDLKLLRSLKARGIPTVVILFSGRPLYVNEELNLSDAFVAAWLPGTEGQGITDVLFRDPQGAVAYDFQGRLSYSWPARKCATAINHVPANLTHWQRPAFEQAPDQVNQLFAFGYGLSYRQSASATAQGKDLDHLPLDPRIFGCKESDPAKLTAAATPLALFGGKATDEHRLRIGDASNWTGTEVSGNSVTQMKYISVRPVDYQRQQDAREVTFSGTGKDTGATIQVQTTKVKGVDRRNYLKADSQLLVTLRMKQAPDSGMTLGLQCGWPCGATIDVTDTLRQLPHDKWVTLSMPLHCYKNDMDFTKTNTPFILATSGKAQFDLGQISWMPASIQPPLQDLLPLDCHGKPAQP